MADTLKEALLSAMQQTSDLDSKITIGVARLSFLLQAGERRHIEEAKEVLADLFCACLVESAKKANS